MLLQSLLAYRLIRRNQHTYLVILQSLYLKLYVNLDVLQEDDLRFVSESFCFCVSTVYLNIFAYGKLVVMEKLEIFRIIIDIIAVIIAGGWLVRLFTIKSRVKQGRAEAEKTIEEAKTNQIDNVRKVFEELYQPLIDDLERRMGKLQDTVEAVEGENAELKKEVAELKEENSRLRKENEELRDAVREIRPDVVPSRRSINAQNQNRNEKGQFAKVEE